MHSYSVQFRITGTNLDPSAITVQLGLQPNQVRVAGERRGKDKIWRESLWGYDGTTDQNTPPREWPSLEDGLAYVLDRLFSKKELIQDYAKSYETIWWCGHFQSSFDGGPTLSISLLRRLADFGAPIFIDNYFGRDDS